MHVQQSVHRPSRRDDRTFLGSTSSPQPSSTLYKANAKAKADADDGECNNGSIGADALDPLNGDYELI